MNRFSYPRQPEGVGDKTKGRWGVWLEGIVSVSGTRILAWEVEPRDW